MSRRLQISDEGRVVTLDYAGLLAYHGGGAVAGATLGFRVMQAAARGLTEPGALWERQNVHVVSGHPGPGYRDAFEYVTRCVTRDHFEVNRDLPGGRYSPYQSYAFQFVVTDIATSKRAVITLREGVMSLRFFEMLRDLKYDSHNVNLKAELDTLKQAIAHRALALELDQLFDVELKGSCVDKTRIA